MENEKRKILIVDDDSFLSDMYALKFSSKNFEVSIATNGVEALKKLKEGLVPDVILMDILMPEMDGFTTLAEINKQKLCPDCVKIILSNKSSQEDKEKGNELGIAGYIGKANFTPTEIVDEVIKILEKSLN